MLRVNILCYAIKIVVTRVSCMFSVRGRNERKMEGERKERMEGGREGGRNKKIKGRERGKWRKEAGKKRKQERNQQRFS